MSEQTFDIQNFIQLLQKNQSKRIDSSNPSRKSSLESHPLSIIYSASEPESSMPDKQNSHSSANVSYKTEDVSQILVVLKELKESGLTKWQNQQIVKAQIWSKQLIKTLQTYQNCIKVLENQFQQQKKGTDQVLQALIKMDETEKQLWSSYNDLQHKYQQIQSQNKLIAADNTELKGQIAEAEENIEFMRKLVLVANQNYQNLENKYKQIQRELWVQGKFKEQRSSPEITSRTNYSKKKSHSPTISDRSPLSNRRREDEFEENYRRLIMRTLKNKAHGK